MRRIILAVILVSTLSISQATEVSGPVSGTWTASGNPYNVIGEISVPAGQTLVIEPGVQVIFQRYCPFRIYGCLQAEGAPGDSIQFTANDTATGFAGLRFYDLNTQADSSRLDYCRFSYGISASGDSAGDDRHGGAVFASHSSKLRISRCRFDHNRTGDVTGATGGSGLPGLPGESLASGHGGAIYLTESDAIIFGNTFQYNHTGDATGGAGGEGLDYMGSLPEVQGGDGGPGGTGTSGRGGALYCADSSPQIIANLFDHNYNGWGRGGPGGEGGNAWNLGSGSAIAGCGGSGGDGSGGQGGAVFIQGGEGVLSNNLFTHNHSGNGQGGTGGAGGLAVSQGWFELGGNGGPGGDGLGGDGGALGFQDAAVAPQYLTMRQTACGQGVAGAGGAPGYGQYPALPGSPGGAVAGEYLLTGLGQNLMVNSILWDNYTAPLPDGYQVEYSCIQGGYPGTGNLDQNPLFAEAAQDSSFLSQIEAGQPVQSPCVDAGMPNAGFAIGTTRTDSLVDARDPDMGFHYQSYALQPVVRLYPRAMTFAAVPGGPNPPDQTLTLDNDLAGSYNFTLSENIGWLTVSPGSGGPVPPPAPVTVSVDIAGLPPAVYTEDVVITAPGAQGSPDTLHVLLNLLNPLLVVEPDSLFFDDHLGYPAPAPQTLTISNPVPVGFNYSITEDISWLSVSPQSGGPVPPSAQVTVTVNPSGLPQGIHEGDITVTAPTAQGSPYHLHVTLVVVNGLSGDLTGVITAGQYHIIDNARVPADSSLTIEAGADLVFEGPYQMLVEGNLEALGTAGQVIQFRNLEGHPAWKGLHFEGGSEDSSRLEHCLITGSDSGGVTCHEYGPSFDHCTITQNSKTSYNAQGAGVDILFCNPVFTHCLISANSISGSFGKGAGVFCQSGSPVFDHCTIADNTFPGPYALGGGMYLANSPNVALTNSIVSGNEIGGLYFGLGSFNATIAYSDFHGNGTGSFLGSPPPQLGLLTGINARGDSCDAYYNILLDPQFAATYSGNYHLLAASPCVDAGDPEAPYDPDSTVTDMGAFYYDQTPGAVDPRNPAAPLSFQLFPGRPNPFNPTTALSYQLQATSHVSLRVYNTAGRLVATLVNGMQAAGQHRVTFDGSGLASGMYFVKMQAGDFTGLQKVVLLK